MKIVKKGGKKTVYFDWEKRKVYRWYLNRQLMYKHNYKNGKKDDECKEWYENGQLMHKWYYKNGKLEGEWSWWFMDGQLKYKCKFAS